MKGFSFFLFCAIALDLEIVDNVHVGHVVMRVGVAAHAFRFIDLQIHARVVLCTDNLEKRSD